MLSNSQPVQAATRLQGATRLARKFPPLNASALTDKEIDNTLAMVFDAWHKTPQEDTDIEQQSALSPATEDSADAQLTWTKGSDVVAALYAPDAVPEAGSTNRANFNSLPWLDKSYSDTPTANQPWLIPGLLCGVAAGASGSSSGSGASAANAPAMTATPGWSASSGWGQANVAHALAIVKGASYTPFISQTNTHSYLDDLGFTTAWSQGYTGQGAVIACIDTGFDLKNSYLTSHIRLSSYCWNFVNDSADVQDDNGHGTMTGSEMCAGPGTGFGITGGAYGAELMVLKALDANGHGSSSKVSSAIYFAVDHGADVINLSLGQDKPDSLVLNALSYAQAHDVVVVAAAGNSAGSLPCYPAAYAMVMPNVIAVGATQTSSAPGNLASFSNKAGTTQGYNFVTAPGVDITGFGTDEQLWSWSGTSVAAPLVAAQAAILASAKATQQARDIVQSIMESADALELMFGGSAAAVGSDTKTGSADASAYERSVFVEDSRITFNALPFDHIY